MLSSHKEGSGAFLARLPDPTVSSSIIDSAAFLLILQRRLGLYLSKVYDLLVGHAKFEEFDSLLGHSRFAVEQYNAVEDAAIQAEREAARFATHSALVDQYNVDAEAYNAAARAGTGLQVTGSLRLTLTGITPPLVTLSTSLDLPRIRATASLWVAEARGTPHILVIWSPGWRPCR